MKKNLFYIMMVGIPGSGKSTLVYEITKHLEPPTALLSSDNYIEVIAQRLGKTYSEIFQDYIKEAEADLKQKREWAIQGKSNIIHDQTNLTVKSRKIKLELIPSTYRKIAFVMDIPDDKELQRRLDSRPGKIISPKIIEFMKDSFVQPSYGEGFDHIFTGDISGLEKFGELFNV